MRSTLALILTLVVMTASEPARAADALADMVKRAPDQTNTLMYIDLNALNTSPMGVKGNWAQAQQLNYVSGVTGLPPAVQQMMVATYLNPSTIHKEWEVVQARLGQAITPQILAIKTGGTADPTSPDLVASPRNAYFTLLEPTLVGFRSPINRQEMVRWQRFAAKNKEPVVSSYLQAAATAASGQHVFLAIDLTDVLDAAGVKNRAKNSRALLGRTVDLDELTKVIVSIKGVSLTVKAGTELEGELRFEFGRQPGVMAPFCKSLPLEALETVGLSIEDMQTWEPTYEGNTVVLRGKYTERGLRDLLVPLMPSAFAHQSPGADGAAGAPTDPATVASMRYFHSVNTLLKELQTNQNNRTLSRISYAYKQYARMMDELPILNVDPDLLKFGAVISSTLREIANGALSTNRTDIAVNANITEGLAVVPNAYQFYGGGPGWGYNYSAPGAVWDSNRQQMNNLVAVNNNSESARRQETWKNINAYSVKTRQEMTERYKVEFK